MLFRRFFFSFLLVFLICIPILVQAAGGLEDVRSNLKNTAVAAKLGSTQTNIPILIGKIINVIVSLLGLIAVVLIIIGGFQWMTSGGEEEKITKAKQLMINGIIGLVIIVLAYAIATFIIGKLVDVVNQPATLPAAP